MHHKDGCKIKNRCRRACAKGLLWLCSTVCMPVHRTFGIITARLRQPKRGRGIGKLYDDVQLCPYEDVQVMWSILQHSNSIEPPKKRNSSSTFWFCHRASI